MSSSFALPHGRRATAPARYALRHRLLLLLDRRVNVIDVVFDRMV